MRFLNSSLLFIILLFNNLYAESLDYNYIDVEIDGLNNDTIQIMYYSLSNPDSIINDYIVTNGNKFVYKPLIEAPCALAIVPKKSFFKRNNGGLYMPQSKFIELIYLPNEKIKIKGMLSKYYLDYEISGSYINEKYAKLRKTFKTESIESCKINLQINSLQGIEHSTEYELKLFEKRNKLGSIISGRKIDFVRENLHDDLSAFILCGNGISLESIGEYYNKLTLDVQIGVFKHMLDNKYTQYLNYFSSIENEKKISIGGFMPSFILEDINGKEFHYEKMPKNKYTILDFWGTWCGPCVREIQTLKSFQHKHKSQITLISIACNENKEIWKSFVHNEGMNWINVIDSNDDKIAVNFGVGNFPTKIIIDSNNKIVGKFVGATEEFYQKMDELLLN